jgi:hypothetical protein
MYATVVENASKTGRQRSAASASPPTNVVSAFCSAAGRPPLTGASRIAPQGGKTVAGPVFVPLFAKATKQPKGCVKAKKSAIEAIRKNPSGYYVNVHTAKYPAGAARGQLH